MQINFAWTRVQHLIPFQMTSNFLIHGYWALVILEKKNFWACLQAKWNTSKRFHLFNIPEVNICPFQVLMLNFLNSVKYSCSTRWHYNFADWLIKFHKLRFGCISNLLNLCGIFSSHFENGKYTDLPTNGHTLFPNSDSGPTGSTVS